MKPEVKLKNESKVKQFRKATKEEKEELEQGLLYIDKKSKEDICILVKDIELVSYVDCINNDSLNELLFE